MTTPPTAFGLLLKQFRGRAGLTQEALAERAGLSVPAVAKLEQGVHYRPHSATVHLLARALTLSPRERSHLTRAAHQRPASGQRLSEDDPAPDGPRLAVRALVDVLAALHSQQHTLVDVFVSTSTAAEEAFAEDTIRVTIL